MGCRSRTRESSDVRSGYLKFVKAATVFGRSSDWAGCKTTPKVDQRRDAGDFERREYNALVRRAAQALGLKAVVDALGQEMPIDIKIDLAAAKPIACGL